MIGGGICLKELWIDPIDLPKPSPIAQSVIIYHHPPVSSLPPKIRKCIVIISTEGMPASGDREHTLLLLPPDNVDKIGGVTNGSDGCACLPLPPLPLLQPLPNKSSPLSNLCLPLPGPRPPTATTDNLLTLGSTPRIVTAQEVNSVNIVNSVSGSELSYSNVSVCGRQRNDRSI